ncbi:hypothetical protein DRW41_04115 [Neobacillus piezotolerans]|uniref:Uncharacterized protein n=1 Tax=Neobacillus piezotolerans TaxID=2259171 RepID=A0A3D8GWC8_9BACI|nr:hypothetical protein [Neobacillus piezotolerans]RDU38753.1 hypothetical protein DRW41_04115 [Neobacillus piezotolerans]
MKILSLMLMVFLFFLAGCFERETEIWVSKPPDAEEVLRLDENADIFQWEGVVYKTDIDWVNELELTKNESIGEITELYTNEDPKLFKDGMTNELPIGAKIYSTNENGILIVEYNGEEKYYLAGSEG